MTSILRAGILKEMEETVNNNPPPNNTPPQSGQQQSSQPTMPKIPLPHLSPFKLILFSGIGFVCLMGLVNVFLQYISAPKDSPGNTTKVTISPTPVPVKIKTFTNKKFHYSVKYPDTLEQSEETPYSTAFTIKQRQFGHLVFPSLYVSVIPDGFTDKAKVYNFMSADAVDKFYTMQDNQSLQTETGTNAEHWIFKRLAAFTVADVQGVMIQNDNVLEGNGAINRRVLLKKNGFTYIIGSYYQSQQELNDYRDFLISFTFLP